MQGVIMHETHNAHDEHDEMQHDARMNATNKTNHTMNLGIAGSLLERWSRGVTTLHHYKRISSRDLEWHRMENGREKER